MQIIQKKENKKNYFAVNIYEKLNLCEDQIYVNLLLPVKMRHWFYVSKNNFENLKKLESIFIFFVFF